MNHAESSASRNEKTNLLAKLVVALTLLSSTATISPKPVQADGGSDLTAATAQLAYNTITHNPCNEGESALAVAGLIQQLNLSSKIFSQPEVRTHTICFSNNKLAVLTQNGVDPTTDSDIQRAVVSRLGDDPTVLLDSNSALFPVNPQSK